MKLKASLLTALTIAFVPLSFAAAADQSASRESYLKNEISDENAFMPAPSLREEKYTAMEESPFAFYRATNPLYYQDLSKGVIPVPSNWKTAPNIQTFLQGDAHAENLGFFDNNNGEVVFDLNDFDESYKGPFYWDLIRFSSSIFLMADEAKNLSLSAQDKENLVSSFLDTYQSTIESVNGNSSEDSIQLDEGYLKSGFVQDELRHAKSSDSLAKLLSKWTVVSNGMRTFNWSNSNLAPADSVKSAITASWPSYIQSLGSFGQSMPSGYFQIKDAAKRLHSGLGSLGTDKYYVLIEGKTDSQDDDVLLQVKEQRLPSMFKEGSLSSSQYQDWFPAHAERSRTAAKALGIKTDNHLGTISFSGKSFRVERISPYKEGISADDFNSRSDMEDFVKYSATAFALAHARSDKDYNAAYVPYNYEQGFLDAVAALPKVKTTILTLSENYAAQVKADYQMYLDLRNNGEL
ncbi:DUF2252 domain-containing protein [Metabacillus sp. GX 13764]|uniref:DUF2252 family protein n=1 Tax=Metabacillus kandeliae TaxID=2900151 RepID=UPI001E627714|nr:DUF2252 family protein [Metabacillus kandeliae]MCD7034931.1 DUF2252 domain-containing protein [Metabacillus kandeliae]